jgi:quercetin dioxygenase-like cupin family protein
MIVSVPPKHFFSYDGVQIGVFHANKGEGLQKHEHIYSHATMCNNGSCKVSLEGRSYLIDKNTIPLNLPAGEWHEIEAMEDNTVFVNIFAERKG